MPGLDPDRVVGRAVKFGRGCAIAGALVVVIAVIGGVIVAISASKGIKKAFSGSSSEIVLSNSASVLSSGPDPSDLTVVVQRYSGKIHRSVARLSVDGNGFDQRWRSPDLPDEAYAAQTVIVGDTLFAAFDDQLWALSADTGAQRWQTTLRNKVSSSCDECLTGVEGRVVVRTDDSWLTAFRPESGESAWTRRLNSPSAAMSTLGGHLYVADDSDEAGQPGRIHTIDPATGRDRRSVAPACKDPDFGSAISVEPGTVVHAVPGTKDLAAVFGFGHLCVARWEAATGNIRFAQPVQGASSINQDEVVVGPQEMVVSDSSGMVALSLANGHSVALPDGQDEDSTPALISGRVLVGHTKTTRGTTKGGLGGWDLATGRRLWSTPAPGGAQAASSPAEHTSDALFDGSPRYVLAGAGAQLHLVVFDGEARRLSVAPLDPKSGDLGTAIETKLPTRYDGTVSLAVEAIGATRVIVSVESVLESIDVATADVHTYP
jgi:outer membrane protein assembly factor BamB